MKLTCLLCVVGSLVVTVPTGRGVSVLDFLCINQQKEMLIEVLKYFKTNNTAWPSVESLVIDKDFTEMTALKNEFPDAEIRPTGVVRIWTILI